MAVLGTNLQDDYAYAQKVQAQLAKLPFLRDLQFAQEMNYLLGRAYANAVWLISARRPDWSQHCSIRQTFEYPTVTAFQKHLVFSHDFRLCVVHFLSVRSVRHSLRGFRRT